jgi:hypothetical protein
MECENCESLSAELEGQMAEHVRLLRELCPYCQEGRLEQVMLDENGTLCSVSGEPGRLGHAWDDFWFYCDDAIKQRVADLERRKHQFDVELVSDHEGKPDGVIDLVVKVNGVECIRWPYADDGVLSHYAKRDL